MTRTRTAAWWGGAIVFAGAAALAAALAGLPGRILSGQSALTSGTLHVRGVSDTVALVRDSAGVPHVFATSTRDALFGLGFVHAQDRRMQMELVRRTARGEAAALSGAAALPGDRLMRTLGVWRLAREEAALLDSTERDLHEAYAAGVNAAATHAGWPSGLLARMLAVRNEPWTVADSILVLKLATLAYATQYREELLTAALAQHTGADLRWFTTPEPAGRAVTVVAGAGERSAPLERLAPFGYLAALRDVDRFMPASGIGAGSNSWAVHGRRTATGRPFLASDPHMALTAPSGVYAAHVSTPGLQVVGVGIPGVPGFFHGHNDRIAWGVTVTGADTEDAYLEEFSGPDGTRVKRPGADEPLEVHVETIAVRNDRPVVHRVRRSSHGPLISDAMPSLLEAALTREQSRERFALALAATALRPAPPGWYLRVMRARDWAEFRTSLARYSGPTFNFTYADVDGHIGYQMAGVLPLRGRPAPTVPVHGWEAGVAWKGAVPFESLPSALDPAEGWIATANARVSGIEAPVYVSQRWGDLSWRVARVRDLLRQTPRATGADMAVMQLDVHQDSMRDVVAWIRDATPDDAAGRRALQTMTDWDYRAAATSAIQPVVEAFRIELARETFGSRLPPALLSAYIATPTFVGPALEAIMNDPDAAFFGGEKPAAREARRRAVRRALHTALETVERRFGAPSPAWGRVHRLTFRSPFAQGTGFLARALGRSLNVGPLEMAGSTTTVQAAAWQPDDWFDVTHGAGYRQIVDLSNFSASRYLPPPPGQSEHSGSRFYSNLAAPLVRGEYFRMLWTRADIEADATSTLTLRP